MRKLMAVAFAMLGVASSAWSQSTTDTHCTSYSSDSMNCSSTTTPTGPTAAQVEQQRELNENASKLGAALGDLIYHKRMQHAQKKTQKKAEALEADKALEAHKSLEKEMERWRKQIKLYREPVAVAQTQREAATQPTPAPAQPSSSGTWYDPSTVGSATPEVSVAEAARQARIAKAVREAKEKAERDNPASPPQ